MSQDARQLHQLLRIGSARAGNALAGLAEPLATLLPADSAIDARLWQGLGALDLWQRSGLLLAPAAAPMDAAPQEHLAACPARAEAWLSLLLRGVHPSNLLEEWLLRLRRHGACLPPRFLPKLLETATRQPGFRPLVEPVLGERGRWLARLQPAWSWALPQPDTAGRTQLWETGTPEQRHAALQAWRTEDPAAARQALMDAWKTEAPEQRAALLAWFAVGLGPEDEAFLESALDDRRKEVRAEAQRLLARLPGSSLSRRMLARLLPLLRVERPLPGAPRLVLDLPAQLDKAALRDGVGAMSHPGLGEKAGWVVDMLAAVDPATWPERFGCTPRACLALAENSEFAAVFVRGWTLAASHRAAHDPAPGVRDWIRDLALWWIDAAPPLRDTMPKRLLGDFVATFRDGREGIFTALLDALPNAWPTDASMLGLLQTLANHGSGWAPGPSARLLQRLDTALRQFSPLPHPWHVEQLLPSLARAIDPATASAFIEHWRIDDDSRAEFNTFFDIVRIRHEMILSFQEPA